MSRTLIVVGDIHAQVDKFWHILGEAGLAQVSRQPSPALVRGERELILLGDLVHPKTRAHYAELIGAELIGAGLIGAGLIGAGLIGEGSFDEYYPPHIERAEQAEEAFLRSVKTFCDAASGHVTVLLGNHDHSALTGEEGVLRTDDLSHLEWRPSGRTLPDDLQTWLSSWPSEHVVDGVHFAHVGPKPEYNRYDAGFYLENRRNWIFEDRDVLAETPYRFGVYGHTPVRGGAQFASQGRALILDSNGVAGEYSYAELTIMPETLRLKLRGVFFDEMLAR